jgi:predicted Rossmann fold flavoprotein
MNRLGIIGAGPAGMLAALEALKAGIEVLLFDANDAVGKKLLVTGSGRCNLSNAKAVPRAYHSTDEDVLNSVFEQCDQKDLIRHLHQLGILTCSTDDGWFYPVSYSAANVVNILHAHLVESGAKLHLAHKINRIIPQSKGFLLKFKTGQSALFVDKLIVATGGKAYPVLGSDGSVFPLLQQIGHEILPVRPALAPLLVSADSLHGLQGVRLDAGLRLLKDGKTLGEATGNIIFTKDGINGPGAMDLSYLVSQFVGRKLGLEINFLLSREAALRDLLRSYANTKIPLQILLGAVVAPKVVHYTINKMHLPASVTLSDLQQEMIARVVTSLKILKFAVSGVGGFAQSQLSTGGVPLTEIKSRTLESKLIEGLFFAGEVLDVNGPCGGYNLQWAFSSGIVAGRWAAQC